MKTATVNIFYDTRRGHNSLKLLLTFDRKQRIYATGIRVEPIIYERLKNNADRDRPDGKIKDEAFLHLWAKLWNQPDRYDTNKRLGIVHIARKIANILGPNFTFEEFKILFDSYGKNKETTAADNVLSALEAKAEDMKAQGRISNGINYGLVAKSLRRFIASLTPEDRRELKIPPLPKRSRNSENPDLLFQHVTTEFLTMYEEWMVHYGKAPQDPKKAPTAASLTTVGIYCRHLRAVFNDALETGVIARDGYPFGKNRYVIPAGKNTKKALKKHEVLKLVNYASQPESMEQRGKDLWVFSYLSNGMNMADICTLRWKDLDLKEETITFIRQKTSRIRKGNQTMIKARLKPETRVILERWGTDPKNDESYVFPFLNDTMSPEQKKKAVQQITKLTNKHIKRVAKSVGIDAEVTTYVARHSFATILLQSEAPLAFISQSLGHTNIKTTENYLGSFDEEQARQYLDALL